MRAPAAGPTHAVPIELDGRRLGELRLIGGGPELLTRPPPSGSAASWPGWSRSARSASSGSPTRSTRGPAASNELTTALLRTVSHDFRSPLPAISTRRKAFATPSSTRTSASSSTRCRPERPARPAGRRTCSTCRGSRRERAAGGGVGRHARPDRRGGRRGHRGESQTGARSATGELPLVRVDAAQLQRVAREPVRERRQVLAGRRAGSCRPRPRVGVSSRRA